MFLCLLPAEEAIKQDSDNMAADNTKADTAKAVKQNNDPAYRNELPDTFS